jgi:excisionase family DNA binding protein
MADTELLTVSQAAEALSASSQTIRNWIRGDRLQGVRIPRSEVERLRGDRSAVTGESPWDIDRNEPGKPLPRAGDRRADVEPDERLLGG